MTVPFTTQSLQDALTAKLALNFGTEPGEATDQEMLKACALVLRDVMALRGVQTAKETKKEQKKQVHYLSLEFLMGRSLMKNAYNLGVLPELKEALGNLGFKSGDLFELEPDAGLGNGGLGRLAACYLDSMTTLDIPATGYSICYELGIFKQKTAYAISLGLVGSEMCIRDSPSTPPVLKVRFLPYISGKGSI